jgi:hypothetical protein
VTSAPWADFVPRPEAHEADNGFQQLEPGPGLLAYDFGRRGFWALEPGQPVQLELAIDDGAGTLIVREAPLGMIGTFELQVAIGLAAVWGEGSRERSFPFRLKDLADRLELRWGGKTQKDLDRALGRLRATTFGATWYDPARAQEHDDRFGLIDSYRLSGRRNGRRVAGEVEWSRWTFARLEAREFAEIDLQTMRRLRSPLARRLYAYCEARSGTSRHQDDDGQPVERFARRIDRRFQATLGSERRELRKFRFDLKSAAADICTTDRRYRRLSVEPGQGRAQVLVVERARKLA